MIELTRIMEDPQYQDKTIATEYFRRASKFEKLKISDEIKARFLVYLVKEFRKNREITKYDQKVNYITRKFEDKVSQRFPSLSKSPDSKSKSRSKSPKK